MPLPCMQFTTRSDSSVRRTRSMVEREAASISQSLRTVGSCPPGPMRRASPKSVVWITSSLLKSFTAQLKIVSGNYARRLRVGLWWGNTHSSVFLKRLEVSSRKHQPPAVIGSEVNLMPPDMVCMDSNQRSIGPYGNNVLIPKAEYFWTLL